MLLEGIPCEALPLDNRPVDETGVCELLGGAAPPCTASRPCPRMVCIPQGIFTESAQVIELFSASSLADGRISGAGMEVIRVATDGMEREERVRLWRLLVCFMRWLDQHREELKTAAKR